MRIVLVFILMVLASQLFAQAEDQLKMGRVALSELDLKTYAPDSSAAAVVLNEFGYAYISDQGDLDLVFEYYLKLKILKRSGFEKANFEIPLYKSDDGKTDRWISVEATTYNIDNHAMVFSKLNQKDVFKETSKYVDRMKFTLPDVREGSVIEVRYRMESPFLFNFHEWIFQSDIPKIRTEFWAMIPANYFYNITLRGYLSLTMNEAKVKKQCFSPSGVGGASDCSFYKYAMDNVPALKEEDFMTAAKNFRAAIKYELVQIQDFRGAIFKYTKEWKDVEEELRTHPDFGAQIRKAKNLFDGVLPLMLSGLTDEKEKAMQIYRYVSSLFAWDEHYGKYSNTGIRKAYEAKKGNVGDINLTLVAILQEAGLDADPVLLSTRENGLPGTLYPVLSDFNYVVAGVRIGNNYYLADATEPFLPFGVLPERCINGQGRLIARDRAEWIDLTPKAKEKSQTVLTLRLNPDGLISGTVEVRSFDYEAAEKRKAILSHENEDAYAAKLASTWSNVEVANYEVVDLKEPEKMLMEKMNVTIRAFDDLNAKVLFLDPFVTGKWTSNPFKSTERLFPVDFGAPLEEMIVVSLEYPANFTVDELPKTTALAIPNGGGRFLFSANNTGGKVSVTSQLQINKSVYSSAEYHALRELFNRVIESQQTMVTLKQKE